MYYMVNINRHKPIYGFSCKHDSVIFDCEEQLINFINRKASYNWLDDSVMPLSDFEAIESLVISKDLSSILY